eukprot:Pgem_evm1s16400
MKIYSGDTGEVELIPKSLQKNKEHELNNKKETSFKNKDKQQDNNNNAKNVKNDNDNDNNYNNDNDDNDNDNDNTKEKQKNEDSGKQSIKKSDPYAKARKQYETEKAKAQQERE